MRGVDWCTLTEDATEQYCIVNQISKEIEILARSAFWRKATVAIVVTDFGACLKARNSFIGDHEAAYFESILYRVQNFKNVKLCITPSSRSDVPESRLPLSDWFRQSCNTQAKDDSMAR